MTPRPPDWTVGIEVRRYGTRTPTAHIHHAASERAARAALYRLAAAVEDRSHGHQWAVVVGDDSVWIEVVDDTADTMRAASVALRGAVDEVSS